MLQYLNLAELEVPGPNRNWQTRGLFDKVTSLNNCHVITLVFVKSRKWLNLWQGCHVICGTIELHPLFICNYSFTATDHNVCRNKTYFHYLSAFVYIYLHILFEMSVSMRNYQGESWVLVKQPYATCHVATHHEAMNIAECYVLDYSQFIIIEFYFQEIFHHIGKQRCPHSHHSLTTTVWNRTFWVNGKIVIKVFGISLMLWCIY